MGLSYKGIEAVEFGNIKAVPQLDQKTKLKLQRINLATEEGKDNAISTLASCFPDNEQEIKDFMMKQMTDFELAQLHAYIIGGQPMLDNYNKQFEKQFDKAFEEVTGENKNA